MNSELLENNRHHEARKLRKMTRWSQFIAMATAQFSGRSSLRDMVANLSAQAAKLYHLGAAHISRSSLARVDDPPHTIVENRRVPGLRTMPGVLCAPWRCPC